MFRRLLTVLSVLLAVPALAGVSPAFAAPPPDYDGIVKLSNCSGSLIRLPQSDEYDRALVLTNGHCLESGMPEPGQVLVDQPVNRRMLLLGDDGAELGELRATKLVYATMTDTDVAIYALDSSYREIARNLGGHPLTVAASPADVGTPVSVVSGYFTRTWNCSIERVVYSVREAGWTWKDSIRYAPGCDTIHGTSGSPIVDDGSHEVVGINNTGNDDGEVCTFNNPCEVDENGAVFARRGLTYGQQTYRIPACFSRDNQVSLTREECMLPKPAAIGLPIPLPA
ncbi:serine protease [Amycolatopsis endophytica]|uniref:V8-like Glu-specific endopeptidase n=1 Tax=Amycolatopsis endophytica TaxID=860233 RepID=A0A853B1L4_9PSEU|nr:serine protease [Amycolatopsis endophytica]NYI89003.1 V8-like Glu-specific endopeptidase [Amycolatopsis endophytica]